MHKPARRRRYHITAISSFDNREGNWNMARLGITREHYLSVASALQVILASVSQPFYTVPADLPFGGVIPLPSGESWKIISNMDRSWAKEKSSACNEFFFPLLTTLKLMTTRSLPGTS
jgi:hypothetical protein